MNRVLKGYKIIVVLFLNSTCFSVLILSNYILGKKVLTVIQNIEKSSKHSCKKRGNVDKRRLFEFFSVPFGQNIERVLCMRSNKQEVICYTIAKLSPS